VYQFFVTMRPKNAHVLAIFFTTAGYYPDDQPPDDRENPLCSKNRDRRNFEDTHAENDRRRKPCIDPYQIERSAQRKSAVS